MNMEFGNITIDQLTGRVTEADGGPNLDDLLSEEALLKAACRDLPEFDFQTILGPNGAVDSVPVPLPSPSSVESSGGTATGSGESPAYASAPLSGVGPGNCSPPGGNLLLSPSVQAQFNRLNDELQRLGLGVGLALTINNPSPSDDPYPPPADQSPNRPPCTPHQQLYLQQQQQDQQSANAHQYHHQYYQYPPSSYQQQQQQQRPYPSPGSVSGYLRSRDQYSPYLVPEWALLAADDAHSEGSLPVHLEAATAAAAATAKTTVPEAMYGQVDPVRGGCGRFISVGFMLAIGLV